MTLLRHLTLAALIVTSAGGSSLGAFPAFETKEIDPHAGDVCYAVTLADVDGDERQDIVVVTENRVLWYRNPDWDKRVIIENQTTRDNVCIAPHDIDEDGKVDFALGAGWPQTGGQVHWLSRKGSLDETWDIHLIGAEPSLHRMRFADVLGKGRPQLVISPLNKSEGRGVKLTAFEIPRDPKSDRWPATVLDDTLNRMHNHWHDDLDADGTVETITASEEGVHRIERGADGWKKDRLSPHFAGEIKTGKLAGGRQFFAAIEPMHGTTVAVYVRDPQGEWQRHVLDETLKRGHALWTADVDRDDSDELVVGHSDPGTGEIKGPGVYVYDAEDEVGSKWTKHVIDNGGVATEDAVAADLNGDGWVDIDACGRGTHNVRVYFNRGGGE